MKTALTAAGALDRYYLETRCKIIEIAANLDRIERGEGATAIKADARIGQLREAIGLLLRDGVDRAERCQMLFSLPYEAGWRAPNSRP